MPISIGVNSEPKRNAMQHHTFVLLSCEKNSIKSILKEINSIPIVSDIKEVEGMYDLVVRLDSSSFDETKKAVVEKIRIIEGVRTCLMLQDQDHLQLFRNSQ